MSQGLPVPETDSVVLNTHLPAPPEQIFDAWLDEQEHSAFTGSRATIDATMYGKHTAYDGYVEGVTLEIDRPLRIVQTWRTSEFPPASPDSRLELRFKPGNGGTALTLVHTDIPKGQGATYEAGWKEHYFVKMLAYFRTARPATKKAGTAQRARRKAAPRRKKPGRKTKAKVKRRTRR